MCRRVNLDRIIYTVMIMLLCPLNLYKYGILNSSISSRCNLFKLYLGDKRRSVKANRYSTIDRGSDRLKPNLPEVR